MNEFKLRTHCPEGHDLRVHGVLMLGMYRCQICHVERTRKKCKGKPRAQWDTAVLRRKAGSHE